MDEMAPRTKRRVYDDPPALGDAAAWRGVAAANGWGRYRDADVLEAFDAFRGVDDDLAAKLERRLSDCVQRLLAKWLGNPRYGREHVHWKSRENDVVFAMRLPQSEAGIAIRKSFVNFVTWGTVDLIRADLKHSVESGGHDVEGVTLGDPTGLIDSSIDLAIARERFCEGDERKRKVLLMDDMGFTQKEIHEMIRVSHVTQRHWTAEFDAYRQQLGI